MVIGGLVAAPVTSQLIGFVTRALVAPLNYAEWWAFNQAGALNVITERRR